MPVRVSSDFPALDVAFYGFETGSPALLRDHERWMERRLFPIIRVLSVRARLFGSASRMWRGADNRNQELSENRVRAVHGFILREGRPVSFNVVHGGARGMGSRTAGGSPSADRPEDRSVALGIRPRCSDNDQHQAARAVRERWDHIVRSRRRSGTSMGEGRSAEWDPFRERLQGYGFTMRRYITAPPGSTAFRDRIRLTPNQIRSATRTQEAYRRGERDAYRAWNGLTPDRRWALRCRGLETLRELCSDFRRLYREASSDTRSPFGEPSRDLWEPGMCEFYRADEERRNRLD